MTAQAFATLTQGRVEPETLDAIGHEVALVEEELARRLKSQVALVDKVGGLTLRAGGKRLRPAFVALAAQATGLPFDPSRTRRLGAGLEMVHMATLIHDDVIDHAATRRGKPTAAAEVGNTASILSGDVLLARAMSLLAEDGDLELIRTVSAAVVDMAEGEVREVEVRGDFDLSIDDHLDVLRRKTASFIEACCESGAIVAHATSEVREALKKYGHHVGIAFQIVDDLLDYRGDKEKTGKPIATDFREAQATLPLILLREKLSEPEAQTVRTKFGGGVSDDELRMFAHWMEARGAFAEAEAMAHDHIREALAALDAVPKTPSRDLLEAVAQYVIRREA
ncbi:polyprenyl synthetase family protein [bacterium]|nr:MAG: polyprenyl synthetase family protein [bacterium]